MISGLILIASLGLAFNHGIYTEFSGDDSFVYEQNSHLYINVGGNVDYYSTSLVCLYAYSYIDNNIDGQIDEILSPQEVNSIVDYSLRSLDSIPQIIPIDEYGHFEYVCSHFGEYDYYYCYYTYYCSKVRTSAYDLGIWTDYEPHNLFIGADVDEYTYNKPTVAMYTTLNNQGNARSIVGGMAEPLPIVQDLGSNFLAGFTELFYKDNNITYLGVFALSFLGIAIVFGMIRLAMNLIGKNTGVK